MGKWLAAASVVIIALLVLIWLQLRAPAEAAVATDQPKVQPPPAAIDTVKKQELAAIGKQVAAATAQSGKVSPASDEFFYHFYDLQPAMLTRQAAKCYTGGIHRVHRNQKVKLTFTNRIKDGEVTVEDVKLSDESTIDDKPMVDCFIKAVKGTHWHDDTLPDWSGPDELIIRPERGMKKYTEENMKYEGDGPDFTDRTKVPGAT
jgi:hypothetical protein